MFLYPFLISLFTCQVLSMDFTWETICERDNLVSGAVRGDIVTRFVDDNGQPTVIMDNLERDVEVKCSDPGGNPKIHEGEMDITPPWPTYPTSADHEPPNSSRASVEKVLWTKNFTTFWKSEKLIKCRSGRDQGCSMKIIEVKDGSRVKGNCTTKGAKDDVHHVMVCDVRDWIQNALSSRHNSDCLGEYDFKAGFEYSFRNNDASNWTKCREFSERSVEHIDEKVSFVKCDISGQTDKQFLVKMQKIQVKSKKAVGLPFLNNNDHCEEASYFWVQRGTVENDLITIPTDVFYAVIACSIFLVVLVVGFLCFRKEIYKRRFITMRSMTGEDPEQGAPLSEYERANSAFESNYLETDKCVKIQNSPIKDEGRFVKIPIKKDVDELVKSDQINPSLLITDMTHLLDIDPRLEIPRDQLKVGYYLGQGQFGTVYEGSVSGLLGEPQEKVVKVAVKEIKDTQAEGWSDELKILSHLEMHLNLVNLLGACTRPFDLPTYILLEYCSFGDLKKFLCKHKDEFESRLKGVPGNYESPYTAKLLLRWSYSIAQGMDYLARMKIMHGDLAARNIMVGENYVAKISDFGLSKVIPYYNEDYKKTQRKLIPWAWMATEYLKTGDFNIKSDVWSYGVVLWEIFTVGNRPYGINADYESEKMKILRGERLPLPELADLMPWGEEVYEEVMMPCWMEEARQRPDFKDIVEKLGGLLGEDEVAQDEAQRKVYEEKQKRRSQAPDPPQRMDSLVSSSDLPPGNGYITMEDVGSPSPPSSGSLLPLSLDSPSSLDGGSTSSPTSSGYSMAVPGGGAGYIGLQQIINT